MLFGCAAGFFSSLVRFFRRTKFNNALIYWIIFFAVLLVMFLMSSGPYLMCCFFPTVPFRDNTCPNMPPRDLLCPSTPNFPWPLCHATPIRPKQPMCDHLRPPWARACGYDRVRGCLCFCVFVACTVCVRILVFGLAGESVYVFCVCLCVCGCPVILRMCLHIYFVFGCVSAYVYCDIVPVTCIH